MHGEPGRVVGPYFFRRCTGMVEGVSYVESLKHFSTGVKFPVPLAAGDAIVSLLSPAVVSMAFGIFQKREILLKYFAPLVFLTFSHAVVSIFSVAGVLELASV